MVYSQLKQLALTVAVLTLVGCAAAPKTPSYVNQPSLDLAALVGNAASGDTLSLPASNALGMDTVIVGRTYFAASGRECRRLLDANSAPIQRVACKHDDGQWDFARDLKPAFSTSAPSSASQTIIPSAGSALLSSQDGQAPIVLENIDVESVTVSESVDDTPFEDIALVEQVLPIEDADMIQRELYFNETLWTFAKRTTGNALNWETIAEINNVDDAKKLVSGTRLSIPAALVNDGG